MSQTLRLQCPGCQKDLRVSSAARGKVIACPACSKKMKIPGVVNSATAMDGPAVESPDQTLLQGRRTENAAPRKSPAPQSSRAQASRAQASRTTRPRTARKISQNRPEDNSEEAETFFEDEYFEDEYTDSGDPYSSAGSAPLPPKRNTKVSRRNKTNDKVEDHDDDGTGAVLAGAICIVVGIVFFFWALNSDSRKQFQGLVFGVLMFGSGVSMIVKRLFR